MQSDTAFPETLHRVSFGGFEMGFVGDWVGGCGVDRIWMSMRCCLRVTGMLSPSWEVQNGHDSDCGASLSSSPEWTALSELSSSSGVKLSSSGVKLSSSGVRLSSSSGVKLPGELGGVLLVGAELLGGEVGLSSGLRGASGLANTANMLLCPNLSHEFPFSSGTIVLPDPKITEWDL